jgi:threonylcarbamoyladenosine tRNA methylthiotransferase MtaB
MENTEKVAFIRLDANWIFRNLTICRNQDEGFDRVDFKSADMYVITLVTENADKQFKQVVKKAMKLNKAL